MAKTGPLRKTFSGAGKTKPTKVVTLAVITAVPKNDNIGPTPERLARAGGAYVKGDTGLVTVRDAPLESLHAKQVISGRQYDAGKKFYHHWYRAGLQGRPAALDLVSGVFGSGEQSYGMAVTEAQAHHRKAYRDSVQILGLKASTVVQRIVCQEDQPVAVGYAVLGWANDPQARAAATEILKDALDRLADNYGL